MKGTFDITCVRRPDGTTAIGHQAVSAPWHLSKPYWDGSVLLVQAVNATAGIFAGDHLEMSIAVERGASVLLTSPSASRIHTMPDGEASLVQKIRVAENGWLEWMPELFIPQRGCRYRQTTEICADAGGRLFFVESLAPGRVAHGESLAFDQVEWTTSVRRAGKLVLAEHYPLNATNHSLRDLQAEGTTRYFASAMLIHDGITEFRKWQQAIAEWSNRETRIGATQLDADVFLFRMMTESSETLKELLKNLRNLLAETIAPLRQSARKL